MARLGMAILAIVKACQGHITEKVNESGTNWLSNYGGEVERPIDNTTISSKTYVYPWDPQISSGPTGENLAQVSLLQHRRKKKQYKYIILTFAMVIMVHTVCRCFQSTCLGPHCISDLRSSWHLGSTGRYSLLSAGGQAVPLGGTAGAGPQLLKCFSIAFFWSPGLEIFQCHMS